MTDRTRIFVECYDANGFYEENYARIILVMEKLADADLVKREWVSSQAVGGSWARSVRCVFDTGLEPHEVKRLMLGLEYCNLDSVPEALHPENKSPLFRFADIDVIASKKKSGLTGRLNIGAKKISSGEVREGESDVDFLTGCREELLKRLDKETKQKLLKIEKSIFKKLEKTLPS